MEENFYERFINIKEITIDDIIEKLVEKNTPEDKIQEVLLSYEIAEDIHRNQYRQSGEPYIIHPLQVADNVLKMEHYDPDSVSAALLHDTVEDADKRLNFTTDTIAEKVNPTVAKLVDGVTKIRGLDYYLTKEQKDEEKRKHNLANTRKIITGLNSDFRIIKIKGADRIHNMVTLQHKSREKQIENSLETKRIYVPITEALGAYQEKNVLEDLSLKFLEPEEYKRIYDLKENKRIKEQKNLEEMKQALEEQLEKYHMNHRIILREQTINTIYTKLKNNYRFENIYDLFYFKILVDSIPECYETMGYVHELYTPVNGRFKDYIFNPRTNMYQSLHTTVFSPSGEMTKVKIRTEDMNHFAAFGISAYLNIKEGRKTVEEIQNIINTDNQFVKKIAEIDDQFEDNAEFIDTVYEKVLTNHVYVYYQGETKEFPAGSTVQSFLEQELPNYEESDTLVAINGKIANLDQPLKNQNNIEIIEKRKQAPQKILTK